MPIRYQRDEGRQKHFIREWRKYRGMTLSQLAARVGVSTASISRLELRDQSYTQPILEAIAEALECSPADLIARVPESAEQEIIDLIQALRPEQREQAIRLLRAFADPE